MKPEPICKHCRYFMPATWLSKTTKGECRRFTPFVTIFSTQRFPRVEPYDWCGMYKASRK